MRVNLEISQIKPNSTIKLCGSKSESNRLLVLQALYSDLKIENLSTSDDTQFMIRAINSNSEFIDIHHAGTAMRFLTSYLAIQEGEKFVLTGSSRMQQRPIKVLVDALLSLGAEIKYLSNDGFPPIEIVGKKLVESKVSIQANVSSQYISSLILIGSKLSNGLELQLDGEITSRPYLEMTLSLLNQIGINTSFNNNIINIEPLAKLDGSITIPVESDWSSASYYYSIVALSPVGTQISLSAFSANSLQGDSCLVDLYKLFGVSSTFNATALTLRKEHLNYDTIDFNLNSSPDLAQTIAVTCLGLGIDCKLDGLHTLKIKETDRLVALKNEIEKFGAQVHITNDSLSLTSVNTLNDKVSVDTYDDHRMAMAFAPLALRVAFTINDAEVVSKSYPKFWDHMFMVGLKISDQNN